MNFKIGQRVKKVALCTLGKAEPKHNVIPVGTEAVVVGFGDPFKDSYDLTVDYSGNEIYTQSASWEPIQYDGNQKITWDACCWLPEHMREKAKEAA